ncbi:ISAzo13 family transposase [Streptomyces hirsutus]
MSPAALDRPKSTRKLAAELTGKGHHVCADTVGDLLRRGRPSACNANRQRRSRARSYPVRDAQFRYINEQARDHRDAGGPVIRR